MNRSPARTPVGAAAATPTTPTTPAAIDQTATPAPAATEPCACSLVPWVIAAGAVAWALYSQKEQ